MSYGLTNHNKVIANYLLGQQYITKLILDIYICNVMNLAFILLRSKSFFCLFVCFLLDVMNHISNFFLGFYGSIYIYIYIFSI